MMVDLESKLRSIEASNRGTFLGRTALEAADTVELQNSMLDTLAEYMVRTDCVDSFMEHLDPDQQQWFEEHFGWTSRHRFEEADEMMGEDEKEEDEFDGLSIFER